MNITKIQVCGGLLQQNNGIKGLHSNTENFKGQLRIPTEIQEYIK